MGRLLEEFEQVQEEEPKDETQAEPLDFGAPPPDQVITVPTTPEPQAEVPQKIRVDTKSVSDDQKNVKNLSKYGLIVDENSKMDMASFRQKYPDVDERRKQILWNLRKVIDDFGTPEITFEHVPAFLEKASQLVWFDDDIGRFIISDRHLREPLSKSNYVKYQKFIVSGIYGDIQGVTKNSGFFKDVLSTVAYDTERKLKKNNIKRTLDRLKDSGTIKDEIKNVLTNLNLDIITIPETKKDPNVNSMEDYVDLVVQMARDNRSEEKSELRGDIKETEGSLYESIQNIFFS